MSRAQEKELPGERDERRAQHTRMAPHLHPFSLSWKDVAPRARGPAPAGETPHASGAAPVIYFTRRAAKWGYGARIRWCPVPNTGRSALRGDRAPALWMPTEEGPAILSEQPARGPALGESLSQWGAFVPPGS